MRWLILVVALSSAACQRSKPASPTAPDTNTPAPQAETWTLSGQVVDALTQQAISGVQLLNTLTDATGVFQVSGTGTRSAQRVTLSAEGFVTRETTISSGTTNPIIDLIPASLADAYRELVRNGFEEPSSLEPLRRWSAAPRFYLDVTMPIGLKVPESDLLRIEDGIRSAVPSFTGGRMQATGITRGTNPPTERGWVVVRFVNDSSADYCGRSYIAVDPGQIEFNYNRCQCGNIHIRSRTIKHEVGHALGFWHTSHPSTLMYPSGQGCAEADLTQRERDVARIAYARPAMNTEPDIDPSGTAFLTQPRRVID